jgi:hypothetical protein
MPPGRFLTRRPSTTTDARSMDLISLALGLGCFALLLGLVEGLRRV